MNYLKTRLSQASTWTGIASLITSLVATGGVFNLATVSTALISAGLFHVNA